MPIYEYRCQGCGHELETLQSMSEEPLIDCPECGESLLKRKISAAAFRLKGGGWYETDFKKDNRRNVAGEAEAKPADKGGESASSDKKSKKSEKSDSSKASSDKKAASGD